MTEEQAEAPRPDDDLVRAAAGGDDEAYGLLVEKYRRRAFGTAMGIVGDPDEAVDVVQDAFVKAHGALADFRGGSSFFTWFYRILSNVALDRLRKVKRSHEVRFDEKWIDGDDSPPDAFIFPRTPEDLLANRQLATALERAIGALSEPHRQVILLREVDGLAYEEIAEAMGTSIGTVMSRLHYARKKLQEALKGFR